MERVYEFSKSCKEDISRMFAKESISFMGSMRWIPHFSETSDSLPIFLERIKKISKFKIML